MEFDECEIAEKDHYCAICNLLMSSGDACIYTFYRTLTTDLPPKCVWGTLKTHLRCWLALQKCEICGEEFTIGKDMVFRAFLNEITSKLEMKPIHHWCGVKRDIKWTLRKLIAWALRD